MQDWSYREPDLRRPPPASAAPAASSTATAAALARAAPLPPPPPQIPAGFVPQVIPLPSAADLGLTPSPPPRAASSGDSVVPETPRELLRMEKQPMPPGHAAGRFNAGGGWSGWKEAINSPAGEISSSMRLRPGFELGRRDAAPSHPPRRTALHSTGHYAAGRPQPPTWLLGRCFHCLFKGRPSHRASECRDPIKCRHCFRSGHRARFCKHPLEPRPSPSTVSPAPRAHRAPPQPAPPAPPVRREAALAPARRDAAMPRTEEARPAEDFVVIHSSPAMTQDAAALLTNAAYAWFDRPPSRDALGAMKRALATKVAADPIHVTVTEHYPEAFLVRFTHPHHRDAAVAHHAFPFGTLRVQVRPWRLEDNAEQVDMKHHVRLCVENVPLYAWCDLTAVQQAIGSACSLDYVEQACQTKEYTKALCVWAWVAKPSLVPRVRWATLPGPNAPPGVRERGRRGLQRRCIVHLDIVEDLSGPVDDPPPPPSRFTWRFGHVDGDRTMRDRTERIQAADQDRRDRDRDRERDREDEERDRQGRRSWGAAIRRSLSRPARDRGRIDDRDHQRERHRSSTRDGRRHAPGPQVEEVVAVATSGLLRPRGRPWARSASPAFLRRRSMAALTPPASPDPASPTSVCHSAPGFVEDDLAPFFLLTTDNCATPLRVSASHRVVHSKETRRLLEHLAPSCLQLTPPRPPGFDVSPVLQPASPTRPPGFAASPVLELASPTAVDTPASRSPSLSVAESESGSPLDTLFTPRQEPLLSPPWSPPPKRPTSRRKTLAGVAIKHSLGFSARRTSARAKEWRKKQPVAKAAETAVCHSFGIVEDGEEVTELAMNVFTRTFDVQVPEKLMGEMRTLFKVGRPEDDAMDEALLSHGGAAGLDHDAMEDGAASAAQ